MKALVFIMAISFVAYGDWLNDFEQAKKLASGQNKLILINLAGSDWCAPCIKMKREVFEAPEFQSYAGEKLILVKADFPRQKKNQLDPAQKHHNERLAEQYNPSGKFPLTLLLTADGKVIREWDGYAGTSATAFVEQLSTVSHGK